MLILWTRRLQRFFGVEQRFGGSAKDSSARSPEKVPRTCHIYHPLTSTLPETRMAPENWWLEYDNFLLRWPIFMCELFSFGECSRSILVAFDRKLVVPTFSSDSDSGGGPKSHLFLTFGPKSHHFVTFDGYFGDRWCGKSESTKASTGAGFSYGGVVAIRCFLPRKKRTSRKISSDFSKPSRSCQCSNIIA